MKDRQRQLMTAMNKTFIIDAEFTGLSFSDMALELAILEVKLDRGFYRPDKYFRRVFSYSLPMESVFAKQFHASLYDECRSAESATPNAVRDSILDFFTACGSDDPKKRILVGSRLKSFKLEVLDKCRFLDKHQVMDFDSGPKEVGDYGEVIDLDAIDSFFAETFSCSKASIEKKLADLNIEAPAPQGQRHRALFDCFVYLKRLNEYRLYLLSPWEFLRETVSSTDQKIQ
jgi:hypothetical protein